MKNIFLISLLSLISVLGHAQEVSDFLPKHPPRDAKQNAQYLFGGFAIQVVGIGITAGSVYLLTELWEDETDPEIAFSGIGLGAVMTVAGTVMVVGGVANIISTRHAAREIRKKQHQKGVTLNIEPTRYGVGIVCRF